MVNIKEKKILDILRDFRNRTGVSCSIIYTEEGFVVSVDHAHIVTDEGCHEAMSAICTSIIDLSAKNVEIVDKENIIKEITIQAGDQLDDEGFTIILKSITYNNRISIIFPTYLNLGVILFELNHLIQKLSNYLSGAEQDISPVRISTLH